MATARVNKARANTAASADETTRCPLLDDPAANQGNGRHSQVVTLGESRFHAGRCPTWALPVTASAKEFRAAIRASVPTSPGVYAMVDRDEAVAYVGKSITLRDRVLNYFVDSPRGAGGKSHPRKEHRVGVHARRLLWQPVGHELVALLRELELIQSLRPRFNVRGAADRGRSGYVYLTADEAPTLRTAATPPAKATRSWGPMLVSKAVREAVERVNHTFGLRDCTSKMHIIYRDQGLLFEEQTEAGCLRAAFGACLAPCAAGCSREQYSQAMRRAMAFLDGTDRSVLDRIAADMQEAARDRKFERAARLRDTWDAFDLLDGELSLLRDTPDSLATFVLPTPDVSGRTQWLVFTGGVAVTAVRPPRAGVAQSEPTAAATRELLNALRINRGPSLPTLKVDFECESARTIASWFRQNPQAIEEVLSIDEAVNQCVD